MATEEAIVVAPLAADLLIKFYSDSEDWFVPMLLVGRLGFLLNFS